MKFLSWILLGILLGFLALAGSGIYLTLTAVEVNEKSIVEGGVGEGELKLRIETAIPGVILVVLGAFGLLVLAMRVPIREVEGYEPIPPRKVTDLINVLGQRPVLSDEVKKVSLLLWWTYYSKGRAVREKPR